MTARIFLASRNAKKLAEMERILREHLHRRQVVTEDPLHLG